MRLKKTQKVLDLKSKEDYKGKKRALPQGGLSVHDYQFYRNMTTLLRRLAFGAGLILAGGYAFVHLRGPQGIVALSEKRRAIQALERDNKLLRHGNASLRKWNEQLRTDEDLQRLILQERYNMLPDDVKEFRTPPAVPESGTPPSGETR